MLQITVLRYVSLSSLAVNLFDKEIETFLLNFGNKRGNLSFGAVQSCRAEKLFPNMLP